LAALAGTAIGGLTSFSTSWMTQQAQARAQRIANEREKREALFGKFLEEARNYMPMLCKINETIHRG
jgi:hypothetical protein